MLEMDKEDGWKLYGNIKWWELEFYLECFEYFIGKFEVGSFENARREIDWDWNCREGIWED